MIFWKQIIWRTIFHYTYAWKSSYSLNLSIRPFLVYEVYEFCNRLGWEAKLVVQFFWISLLESKTAFSISWASTTKILPQPSLIQSLYFCPGKAYFFCFSVRSGFRSAFLPLQLYCTSLLTLCSSKKASSLQGAQVSFLEHVFYRYGIRFFAS